ncbi:MAG: SDR family NAD(P)-dependent oxidoreductase [Alphaproteobacteria bacterium]|nr:SDR family NAD(P)-dependent oxidoreductase [Alphaproteobacteria bacterium]
MNLKGQTALVTGGARGIGRELTRQLAGQGARVVMIGRNRETLEEMQTELSGAVTGIPADLSCSQDVDHVIATINELHGTLSVLINNAAIQTEMNFFEPAATDYVPRIQRELALNLEAAICLTTGLLPLLRRQPAATIVNVSSGLAIAPKRSAPVYCATKAGLRSFTRAMRYQCAERAPHIHVMEAVMALVDTDMTRGRGSGKISPLRAAREIVAGIERGRDEVWVAKAALLPLLHRFSPSLVAHILK